MAQAQELTTEECAALLRSGVVGRVAFSSPGGPQIVPVNYSVVDEMIVFRTTPYSLLGTYATDTPVAFEIDQVDHEYWSGWSVVARGRCRSVDDAEEVRRINHSWGPRPWAAGQRNLYLALEWTELTGRRLGPTISSPPVERRVAGR